LALSAAFVSLVVAGGAVTAAADTRKLVRPGRASTARLCWGCRAAVLLHVLCADSNMVQGPWRESWDWEAEQQQHVWLSRQAN
jgi:hypothetical protein